MVFVRHGSVFVRVSANRLCKINPLEYDLDDMDDNANEIVSNENADAQIVHKDSGEQSKILTETDTDSQVISEDVPAEETKQAVEPQWIERSKLKINDQIQYMMGNSDEWVTAKVIGRAGKATGKYKDWYNVQDGESNEQKSVDLSQYIWKKVTNDDNDSLNVHVTTCNIQDNEIGLAKETELKKLSQFNTYEEVENNDQPTLTTRWVITNKDGKAKARLVVRGFEEDFILPRDSPAVGKGAMRTVLAIASSMKWVFKTTDIKSAFFTK